jgi:hypothetical protein
MFCRCRILSFQKMGMKAYNSRLILCRFNSIIRCNISSEMKWNIDTTTIDFEKIRKPGTIYVDKTESLYSLVRSDTDNFYFIDRPRRFGKSFMCSTINRLFWGSSHLFDGLWIKEEGKWNYKKVECPVIHLDMSRCGAETKEEKRYKSI